MLFEIPLAASPISVTIADFNGDGNLDLAVAALDPFVRILLGDGTGSFLAPGVFFVGDDQSSLAVDDFNRDGILDLYVAKFGGSVSILVGDPTGAFIALPDVLVGASPFSLAAADLNGDGRLDLAVSNTRSDTVSILLGDGVSLKLATDLPVGTEPLSVVAGDLNRDGTPDLATANFSSGDVSILLNLLITDRDGDGIADDIDRNKATQADESQTFSNDFSDIALGGRTSGTITDRGGWRVAVVEISPDGVQAGISGAGTVAKIGTCDAGGTEEVSLDVAGERANITCETSGRTTVTALVALPTIELRKPSVGPAVLASLPTGQTATVGSAITASPANARPILVHLVDSSDMPFGSFQLDAGESVDVQFVAPGAVEVTVLSGTVTITVATETATLSETQTQTFTATTQIGDLTGAVRSLRLDRGIETSLLAKLRNASAAAQRGSLTAACNQLVAFINEVQAQAGKAIGGSEAGRLITGANQIMGIFDCPG